MHKKWKVVLSILIGLVSLTLILSIAGSMLFHHMQEMTQVVYGGSIPTRLKAILGWDFKTYKVAVYGDTITGQVVAIMERPPVKSATYFSEPDVYQALSHFDDNKQTQALLPGAEVGLKSTFKLKNQLVHTLSYHDKNGRYNQVGVLNLDHNQMLFIVTAAKGPITTTETISSFLSTMPAIQGDSHLK